MGSLAPLCLILQPSGVCFCLQWAFHGCDGVGLSVDWNETVAMQPGWDAGLWAGAGVKGLLKTNGGCCRL